VPKKKTPNKRKKPMPTAPPGGAVLAPALSGDGKEVITSTNTTVRLLPCFHDFSYYESTIFFLPNIFYQIFSQMLKTEKKMPFLTNEKLKILWEKVRRFVKVR
jgi:hypothetical protein